MPPRPPPPLHVVGEKMVDDDASPARAHLNQHNRLPNAEGHTPDWLQQATAAERRPKHQQRVAAPRRRAGGGPKIAAQSPLSWMSSMKRRSSMDLNDPAVEEAIAQAKAKTVPGGWLQLGALGAPDAVEEQNALEEARAASSHLVR